MIDLWIPPKPAIIRPAEYRLLKPAHALPLAASFLPGMFPGAGNAAPSIAFVASATSTASTIVAPADIQAGDLIVMADAGQSTGAVTRVTPTNFTSLASFAPSGTTGMVFSYKKAVGNEGGTNITGMNTPGPMRKAMLVLRRSPAAATVTPSAVNSEGTTGDPSSQNAAASGGTPPLVVLAAYFSTAGVTTKVFSPAADGNASPNSGLSLDYKIYNTAPQDTTIDEADSGTNGLASCYIEMA